MGRVRNGPALFVSPAFIIAILSTEEKEETWK
jgi:hypothetical protein